MVTMVEVGSSSASFGIVPKEALPVVWTEIVQIMKDHPKGLIEFAEPQDVLHELLSSNMLLWVGMNEGQIELVVLQTLESTPKSKRATISWLGGKNLKFYMAIGLDKLELCSKQLGADVLTFRTSSALVRLTRRYGFQPVATLVEKNLKNKWSN